MTIVITGANRGIGLALCQHYQSSGQKVIGVCRQSSDEMKKIDIEFFDQKERN